jgi:hypothetical protein
MTSKLRLPVALAFIVGMLAASVSVSADEHDNDNDIDTSYEHAFEIHGFDFEEPEFYGVWERTDRPVLEGDVARSWLWGPAANTEVFEEPYEEADDGTREVQYGDKSRMEMPVPGSTAAAPEDSPWAITQGLLAIELMTGNLQLGDDTFEQYEPADIPVAGDWENNPGPTYAHMAQFMDWEPRPAGSVITQYLDLEEDTVLDDDRFAEYEVTDVGGVWQEVEGIDNNIASVFWEFMQSEGLVYEDGDLTEGPLFLDEFYAIGYPTTEAYWGVYRLRGEIQDILTQCFERRCLTYAPDNDPEWQVESGNVGLHYHEWRYNIIVEPVVPEPEPFFVVEPADAENTFYEGEALVRQQAQIVYDSGFIEETTVEDIFDDLTNIYEQEDVAFGDFETAIEFIVPGLTSAELVALIDDYAAAGINVHTVQAHFREDDADGDHLDMPGATFDVTITHTDAGDTATVLDPGDIDIDVNDEEGRADITYSAVGLGSDTIDVTATVDGVEYEASATKTWVEPAPELTLELAQVYAENVVGTTHELTATLTDGDDPVTFADEDVEVTIERDGAALETIENLNVTVDGNIATISYTGPGEAGVDEIDVTVTVDGTEVVGEPTLTKTWVAGS